jgi:hypothetical protein
MLLARSVPPAIEGADTVADFARLSRSKIERTRFRLNCGFLAEI